MPKFIEKILRAYWDLVDYIKNPKEIYERIKDRLYNSSCIGLGILGGLIYIVIRVLPIVIILAIIL